MAIVGDIDTSTVSKFAVLLSALKTRAPADNYLKETVKISSKGGNVSAAIQIGRLFRQNRLSIAVEQNDFCISACVLILAGAVERFVLGTVGIHRPYLALSGSEPSLTRNQVKLQYENSLKDIRTYLREMNVSEKLADDMMLIEPENVRYLLRPQETFATATKANAYNALKSYGLSSADPVNREVGDVMNAQKLGIDRREYFRRKSHAQTLCGVYTGTKTLECWSAVMKCPAGGLLQTVECLPKN